jgi:hypothetical protein
MAHDWRTTNRLIPTSRRCTECVGTGCEDCDFTGRELVAVADDDDREMAL